jgi:hypothetical protein
VVPADIEILPCLKSEIGLPIFADQFIWKLLLPIPTGLGTVTQGRIFRSTDVARYVQMKLCRLTGQILHQANSSKAYRGGHFDRINQSILYLFSLVEN